MELGLEALSCLGSWASCLGGRSDRSKCILTDSRPFLISLNPRFPIYNMWIIVHKSRGCCVI